MRNVVKLHEKGSSNHYRIKTCLLIYKEDLHFPNFIFFLRVWRCDMLIICCFPGLYTLTLLDLSRQQEIGHLSLIL